MRKRGNQGFGLLETILVIAVISAIFAVTAELLLRGLSAYQLVSSRQDILERAELAMDRMVREIRLLGISSFQGPLGGTTLTFRDTTGTVTNFSLNGNTLSRGNDSLATGIFSLSFSYWDKNGNSTNAVSKVRRVAIGLTLMPNDSQTNNITLRSQVFPRNFVYGNFQ
ncbi:MAG: hypothetical protein HYS22_04210 [Deltaproteobacteria bacterium]|nr:hypothetical protein [Deltaproteobacteria bacterium]